MKDTRVVILAKRRSKDAQSRIDKVFSKILELSEKRIKNEDEVIGK